MIPCSYYIVNSLSLAKQSYAIVHLPVALSLLFITVWITYRVTAQVCGLFLLVGHLTFWRRVRNIPSSCFQS